MFYHAKNESLKFNDTDMDYITFGNGNKVLVMIPGLGDGLRTVKGTAVTFSVMYKTYAQKFKVYVFSRKNKLPEGYTTRQMAKDQVRALRELGIQRASIMGVSEGGMIAQYIAIDYPDMVDRLVLAVTTGGQNETVKSTVGAWIKFAEKGEYSKLFIDTAEKSYSENKLRSYRKWYPIIRHIGKPKSYERFLIQANACLTHDANTDLHNIKCHTFLIVQCSIASIDRNMAGIVSIITGIVYRHPTYI